MNILMIIAFLYFINTTFCESPNDEIQLLFNRTDLHCPFWCALFEEFSMECCICHSESKLLTEMGKLVIDYTDNYKNAVISKMTSEHIVFSVTHTYGNLTKIPDNACFINGIIKIDFSFNNIVNIDTISCVKHLDTLILKGNKVEYLRNDTFIDMKFIRVIDLSYNNLKYIEPGFLINMAGNLFQFDVSHNSLKAVDITNIIWTKQQYFCYTDFSNNKISLITNELHWKCSNNSQFGNGGMVDFSNNAFTYFLNLSDIGFSNLYMLGKLMAYGFDFRGNDWICDCRFYPFILAATPVLHKIFREYFRLSCYTPPEFKDMYIINFIENNALDRLICNISIADKCPPKCYCFYQPDKARTVVNCSDIGMKRLPPALPENWDLDVDLSHNEISNLKLNFNPLNRKDDIRINYIKRIKKLNLSNNTVNILPDIFLYQLINASMVNLTINEIVNIPRALQAMNPCQVSLGNVVIDCKCDDIWLQTWLPSTNDMCYENTKVFCKGKSGLTNISNMTKESLGCRVSHEDVLWLNNVLAASFFVVVIASMLIFSCRFELFIITRKCMKYLKKTRISYSSYTYDVYISCNEQDESLRLWLSSCLVPYLESNNLRVFLPYRDSEIGRPREEEIIEVMSKSLNFVIFLSDEYSGSFKMWVQKEWKYSWHNYKSDLNREIIIINYDMLECKDVDKKYFGAFLRLHNYIDFSNHRQLIKEDIVSVLQKSVPEESLQVNDLSRSTSNVYLSTFDTNIQNEFTEDNLVHESSDDISLFNICTSHQRQISTKSMDKY